MLTFAGFALISPSAHAASSTTFKWADPGWLSGGEARLDAYTHPLSGVYCHELDSAQTRYIEITGYYGNYIYFPWARFTTEGYRSGFPGYAMRGACYNPHSVGYFFNAHDNYFI